MLTPVLLLAALVLVEHAHALSATPGLRADAPPTTDQSTSLSVISSLQDSMGSVGAIVLIIVIALVLVTLGFFLARKFLRGDHPKPPKSSQEDEDTFGGIYDPDNLKKMVGLEGVTPGPRIMSTDLKAQRVVGKLGSCLICQAERASVNFQQSRFFDFKLSGFSRLSPNDPVTVKKIVQEHGEQDDPELRMFVEEIDLMASLEHPKIVGFLGVSWNTLRDVSMVLEYMGNGSVSQLLAMDRKREAHGKPRQLAWFDSRESRVAFPPLPSKASIAMDIVEGLAYLHGRDPTVLHRQLSSDVVLLSNDFEAKLAHLAAPSLLKADVANSPCVAWTAPEVLKGEPFTTRSDMYAFGVILTELANGTRAFDGVATASIVLKVTTEDARPTITDRETPDFIQDLATRCLSANPQDRPTAGMAMPELLFRINRIKAANSNGSGDAAAAPAGPGLPPRGPPGSKDDKQPKNGWGMDGFFRR